MLREQGQDKKYYYEEPWPGTLHVDGTMFAVNPISISGFNADSQDSHPLFQPLKIEALHLIDMIHQNFKIDALEMRKIVEND
jgi:hypothetical protein